MSTLFHSRQHAGLVMNQYGVVLQGAQVVSDALNGAVKREAAAAGWRPIRGPEYEDVGLTWTPPNHCENPS